MQLLDDVEFGLGKARCRAEDGRVSVPLEPRAVDEGRSADGDLANRVGQARLRANGAEQGGPACEEVLAQLLREWISLDEEEEEVIVPSVTTGECKSVRSSGIRPLGPRRA